MQPFAKAEFIHIRNSVADDAKQTMIFEKQRIKAVIPLAFKMRLIVK
jgi:hypothetical protein